MIKKAYLDTCIVSGLAKEDLSLKEQEALSNVLHQYKKGFINLVTSEVVKKELEGIPDKNRKRHETIYYLLSDVPMSQVKTTDSGLMMMGMGGGVREDSLYTKLKKMLPDENDANHIFQAIKSSANYFVTVDNKTILRYHKELESEYNIKTVLPSELVVLINCK